MGKSKLRNEVEHMPLTIECSQEAVDMALEVIHDAWLYCFAMLCDVMFGYVQYSIKLIVVLPTEFYLWFKTVPSYPLNYLEYAPTLLLFVDDPFCLGTYTLCILV